MTPDLLLHRWTQHRSPYF